MSALPVRPAIAAPLPPLTSRRNPLVRQLRDLREARGRREQGLLLVEGTHLLQEVLRLGLTPRLVLATNRWCASHGALLASLPVSVPLQLASEEVLAAAASTDHPDGVLLTLPLPQPRAEAPVNFLLVLDCIQDPGNLGTLLRTALAAGVDQLVTGRVIQGVATPGSPRCCAPPAARPWRCRCCGSTRSCCASS